MSCRGDIGARKKMNNDRKLFKKGKLYLCFPYVLSKY